MRTVIYSQDFEPITVVDLPVMPEQIFRYMGGRVRLMAIPPLSEYERYTECDVSEISYRVVTLTMESLRWKGGSFKWVFIADCDETALLLEPDFLPGQRRAVQDGERAKKKLAELFLAALRRGLGDAE